MRIKIPEQFLTEDFRQFPTPETINCDQPWAVFSSAQTSMSLCFDLNLKTFPKKQTS